MRCLYEHMASILVARRRIEQTVNILEHSEEKKEEILKKRKKHKVEEEG